MEKKSNLPGKLEFSRAMLRVNGCLSDAENAKVERRIGFIARSLRFVAAKSKKLRP